MNIGTGKDLYEYSVEGKSIPYHLIDIKEPGYKYNISEFQKDFSTAFHQIQANEHMPILCGGSGLYIETALHGNTYLGIPSNEEIWQHYKTAEEAELEQAYQNLSENIKGNLNALTRPRKIRAIEIGAYLDENPDWKPVKPPKLNPLIIGVKIDRDERRAKITSRLSYRMNHGLIEEVETLLNGQLTHADLAYYGLEYKWVGKYLKQEISKRELFEQLNIAIHQFAKRQMTWFRRMEKNGYVIHWVDANTILPEKLKVIQRLIV